MANEDPRETLQNLPLFSGQEPLTQQVLEGLVSRDPYNTICYSGHFAGKPYAQAIMERAVVSEPSAAITFFTWPSMNGDLADGYSKQSWAES
ncbi:MAG: hypothetical protein AAB588_05830, partial [Patescibacteria group bacterium]